MDPVMFYPVLISAGLFLLLLAFMMRFGRRSWRMMPHYKAISSRLLEAQTTDASSPSAPLLSFDHFNNFGAITYTAHITLPGCDLLPSRVSAHSFRSPNTPFASEEGIIWFHSAFLTHQGATLKVKSYYLLRELAHDLDVQAIHDYLDAQPHLSNKDLSYSGSDGALTWSFYIYEGLFRQLPKKSTPEEYIQLVTSHLRPLLTLLAGARPAFKEDADRWIALHKIAFDDETAVYTLKKALSTSPSSAAKLREHILTSQSMGALHVLLDHDLKATLDALSPDQLLAFTQYATEHTLYTPEFVSKHFAAKLPFSVLIFA